MMSIKRSLSLIKRFVIRFFLTDELYIKVQYKRKFGHSINLKDPKTYNEKLNWLKLNYHPSLYVELADKYKMRKYVTEKIGENYLIPLLGHWKTANEIDYESLPNEFVLKTNHDSGGVWICHDKNTFDRIETAAEITEHLKNNYYLNTREWVYKDIERCVVAEQLMRDESGYELKDYKFFCFDGKVKALFVASDRENKNEETKFDFFDENFSVLDIRNGHPNSNVQRSKPESFEEMKEICEKLSEGIPHVRVDLYNINGKIYVGELTFFHWGGFVPFEPEEWDYTFGSWLELPNKE